MDQLERAQTLVLKVLLSKQRMCSVYKFYSDFNTLNSTQKYVNIRKLFLEKYPFNKIIVFL